MPKAIIHNSGDLIAIMSGISQNEMPISLEWKPLSNKSQPMRGTLHMWFSELSKYLIKHGRKQANPEWCKRLLKHTFLGSVEIDLTNAVTGEVTRQYELVATESLDKGEYLHFMNQVFDWCVSIGCQLTVPIKSEYRELIERQNSWGVGNEH